MENISVQMDTLVSTLWRASWMNISAQMDNVCRSPIAVTRKPTVLEERTNRTASTSYTVSPARINAAMPVCLTISSVTKTSV